MVLPVSAAPAVMQMDDGALVSNCKKMEPFLQRATPVSPVTPLSVLVHVDADAN